MILVVTNGHLEPNEEQVTLNLLIERQAETFEKTSPRPYQR